MVVSFNKIAGKCSDLSADRSDFRRCGSRRERNAVRELKKRCARRSRAEGRRAVSSAY
jgi:hypothetical protein